MCCNAVQCGVLVMSHMCSVTHTCVRHTLSDESQIRSQEPKTVLPPLHMCEMTHTHVGERVTNLHYSQPRVKDSTAAHTHVWNASYTCGRESHELALFTAKSQRQYCRSHTCVEQQDRANNGADALHTCVTWLIHVWKMTKNTGLHYSIFAAKTGKKMAPTTHLWHTTCTCETYIHDSYTRGTWLESTTYTIALRMKHTTVLVPHSTCGIYSCGTWLVCVWDMTRITNVFYKVAKTHRIPYLHRSFSAKVTYI